MVSARLLSKSYTCFQWTGAECRTFQHQHSQSPGTWTKNLERRKKRKNCKYKQQFIWYQLQKWLITDTINLHTGFVLTGNFLYFISQDQHLPHPPKQQQKSIRYTGCYFKLSTYDEWLGKSTFLFTPVSLYRQPWMVFEQVVWCITSTLVVHAVVCMH